MYNPLVGANLVINESPQSSGAKFSTSGYCKMLPVTDHHSAPVLNLDEPFTNQKF